jgi:hypothetical protein
MHKNANGIVSGIICQELALSLSGTAAAVCDGQEIAGAVYETTKRFFMNVGEPAVLTFDAPGKCSSLVSYSVGEASLNLLRRASTHQ